MAARKQAAQKSSSAPRAESAPKAEPAGMGMATTWKWLYAVGLVVAGVAGALAFRNDILTWILILVGVLVGWFYFDPEDLEHFGLRFLILFAVQAALSAVPAVGGFITGFFGGLVGFLAPVVLTMAAHFLWSKRFATLF